MATGRPRPLLVPDAEVVAKNMRAEAILRLRMTSRTGDEPAAGLEEPAFGEGVVPGAAVLADAGREKDPKAREGGGRSAGPKGRRFGRAPSEEKGPGVVERIKMSLGLDAGDGFAKKLWPILEKGAALVSKMPEPTVLFLAVVWVILVVRLLKKELLLLWVVKLPMALALTGLVGASLLWGRTELFARLREGQRVLKGPTEEKLDGLQTDLKEREGRLKKSEQELKKNRAKLDILKQELRNDPIKDEEDRVVRPSKKAVEMIASGALGQSYDRETAEAAEARRKMEAVKRAREEWKILAAEAEDDGIKDKIRQHAATVYRKRTKQLKSIRNVQRHTGIRAVAGNFRVAFSSKEKSPLQNPAQTRVMSEVPSAISLGQNNALENDADETASLSSKSSYKGKSGLRKLFSLRTRSVSHNVPFRHHSERAIPAT